ncbi:hypothetical protein ETD86_26800 [Nonomuraea turkmeniaca]|uniref:Uncharacterized protein n=1 Tax=Nonomuraea turkmeniaca TaxID=103838 RepID=A0A5S4FC31_9ACTN|nr:hypothetical protein [Nonomuraea turkmeniaca]TMR15676.1 hypothetical protein ETD86_26800 [Nonomuraea turkmeniaca]
MVPQPDSWTTTKDGTVLDFPVTGDRVEVQIQLSPDQIGTLRGAIGAPGQQSARSWQFVYP